MSNSARALYGPSSRQSGQNQSNQQNQTPQNINNHPLHLSSTDLSSHNGLYSPVQSLNNHQSTPNASLLTLTPSSSTHAVQSSTNLLSPIHTSDSTSGPMSSSSNLGYRTPLPNTTSSSPNQSHATFPSPSILDNQIRYPRQMNYSAGQQPLTPISPYSNQASASTLAPLKTSRTLPPPGHPPTSELIRLAPGDNSWENRPRTVLVNEKQCGNNVLRYIHNVQLCVGPTQADFEFGGGSCALYLSLKFHATHPKYIISRFEQLTNAFTGRYLLVFVDLDQGLKTLNDLTVLAYKYRWTVVCSWSFEESARYLEAFRILRDMSEGSNVSGSGSGSKQNRAAFYSGAIKGKQSGDASAQSTLLRVCQVVKGLNKTDINTILNEFDSFDSLVKASKEELSNCPGFGPNKVNRLHKVFRQPLSNLTISSLHEPQRSPQSAILQTPGQVNQGRQQQQYFPESQFEPNRKRSLLEMNSASSLFSPSGHGQSNATVSGTIYSSSASSLTESLSSTSLVYESDSLDTQNNQMMDDYPQNETKRQRL